MTDYGEPWTIGKTSIVGESLLILADDPMKMPPPRSVQIDTESVERIVACVNYCKGYDNPADIPHAESYINMSLELEDAKATIKQLRDLLLDKDDTINSLTKQMKAYEKE